MQQRASVGDGVRPSSSSTPSNSSGGSEPDDIERLGDVYIWGEVFADGVSSDGTVIQVPSKTEVLIPRPLESNIVHDVRHIESGAHHLAIVNKKGEVFTWGEESGGRLGHGIDKHFGQPRLVEYLADATLDIVACGEYHTCAVTKSSDLFTWGDGTHNAGLLGHGSEASHWIPKRVSGALDGLQVVSVACGTWHSALTTLNGKLFTFGDGTFGVLGHGNQESLLHPKEVQLLGGLKTIKVACGVWHTVAIVEVTFQSGSNASSWKLFTWGDGDKYRLGHGNKETYLRPTRVTPLIEYNFHQIACGHTMTVALTTSGHVFTMGSTENGQLGNPMSAGKVPTLVQDKLLGEFVEEISCGAHHVVALTSRNELYSWGKGANGRLGHGDTDDRKSPTLVEALKDRHIKNISCGSNFTSCICIHKWVTGTEQSVCSGCRQAFGLTRKRHNCFNCGSLFCHTCSSRKALKAAMAPSPEKPHRVCDTCFTKLNKIVETGDPSKHNVKATPTTGGERLDQGVERFTRILLSSVTEPVEYLEIKNNKPGTEYGSTSFVRASQVPSPLKLKDIAFPSVLKHETALSSSQSLPADSAPKSPNTSSSSPPRSLCPRFSKVHFHSLKKTYDLLNKQILNLQSQIRSLEQRSDMKDVEVQKLQKQATEAIALAAVESSSHREAREFIESTKHQLKEMSKKLPVEEFPETKILSTVHSRADDFLKEILESELSSISSVMESNQQSTLAADNGSPLRQKIRLKDKPDIVEDDKPDIVEDGKPYEMNVSKLDSLKQQHPVDKSTSESEPSSISSSVMESNQQSTLAADNGFPLRQQIRLEDKPYEMNVSKLEDRLKEQHPVDKSTSASSTFELQEHRQVESAAAEGVEHCQGEEGSFLEEINRTKFESEQQIGHDDILEKNDDTAGASQSQNGGHDDLRESNASSSIFDDGEAVPPQNSENGSSIESSTQQEETQVIEKFERGVYLIIMLRPDGIKIFKRVKFSKRRFTENQAQDWWSQNKVRVLRKYCPIHQNLTTESCNLNIKPHANENI